MKVIETALPGVLIVEPRVFGDDRGFFLETYERARYLEAGIGCEFVQDNHARSRAGVLRGLHYQLPPSAQAKLVCVARGRVLDVAADVRVGSPTFGRHVAVELSEHNQRQVFIPAGYAHGLLVLDDTDFLYKCSAPYRPADERGVRFDDPTLAIAWPLAGAAPVVSAKDAQLPYLAAMAAADLPRYDDKERA